MRGGHTSRSEVDWWLCETCQSLNNLSARRCYSCRERRPRDPLRAGDLLGYRAVVGRDGKVSFEPRPAVEGAPRVLPPLRDPVPPR
jgi:hypothetical protein